MQNKFSLAATCVLLALVSWQTAQPAATTVRPYKFGFTIEEQQHRQEQRDERGIVMGEFGFITADGIYHVTVYATDEEGKFRIISMKSYPYAGPVATKSPPALTTTTRTPPPQSLSNVACSGCLLPKPPAASPGHHKTEIRPLSLPLAPAPPAPFAPPARPGVAPQARPGVAPPARPAAAAPTPPPGIFPGVVPVAAVQPGRLVPEVYLSQTEKLVQFAMRQLQTPPTPAPPTTPAPRVPRPTPPGFPIPGQPVLQLPIQNPASLPLVTPLRITAQSPFPPLAPPMLLGLATADRGFNVPLPFQQSIAQSVDAALAESQQLNSYTSTHTQTQAQTLPQGVGSSSSSSSSSSYSSSFPSGAAIAGNKVSLQSLNTQIQAGTGQPPAQLGIVQPASFDVSKLDRIPPAASGPKDIQSNVFGTRPQATAQLQSGQPSRIPALSNPFLNGALSNLVGVPAVLSPKDSSAAALAESQQLNSYTSTETQTLPQVGSSSSSSYSSSSSFSSGVPSEGAIAGNKVSLQSLNTQILAGTGQPPAQLGIVQPATFDVGKLDRIPPAASGPKDIQSNVFGTRPQGTPQIQSGQPGTLSRIPAVAGASHGNVLTTPTEGSGAVGTAGQPSYLFANPTPGSAALERIPAITGTPVGIAAAAQSTLPGTLPAQQSPLYASQAAVAAAAPSISGFPAVSRIPAVGLQSAVFGSAAPASLEGIPSSSPTQQGSLPPQGAAAAHPVAQGNILGDGFLQYPTPNLAGILNAPLRPTPTRPALIDATPSPLRIPYPVPPLAQSVDRLNGNVVHSMRQVVLPVTQTIPKLMRGPPALEKFLHQATAIPARLHPSAAAAAAGSGHAAGAAPQDAAAVTPLKVAAGFTPHAAVAFVPHAAAAFTPQDAAPVSPLKDAAAFTPHAAAGFIPNAAAVTPLKDAAASHHAAAGFTPHSDAAAAFTPHAAAGFTPHTAAGAFTPLKDAVTPLKDAAVTPHAAAGFIPHAAGVFTPHAAAGFTPHADAAAAVTPLKDATPTPHAAAAFTPHTAAAATPLNGATATHHSAFAGSAAATPHAAAITPLSTAGVANRPEFIAANKIQNIALPVAQHIGDLHAPQHTHPTPAQYTPTHSHTPSSPTLSAQPSRTPFAAVGNAAPGAKSPNLAGTATQTGAAQAQYGKPTLASAGTQTGAGQAQYGKPTLASAGTQTGAGQAQFGKPTLANAGTLGAGAAGAGAGAGSAAAGANGQRGTATGAAAGETGDLYHFKYLLDYNGHEETGSRNGNKEGNYFAIGDDAVARTIEYIANEFGFQPHISWRKLDQSELNALPKDENALKHYEFKWFNKPGE